MVLIKSIADDVEDLGKHLIEVRRFVCDNSSSDFTYLCQRQSYPVFMEEIEEVASHIFLQ